MQEIRESTNKGLAIGHNKFKDEIEKLTGRRMTAGKCGRPKVTLNDLQRVAALYLNPVNANIAVLTDSVTAGREAAGLGLEVVEL